MLSVEMRWRRQPKRDDVPVAAAATHAAMASAPGRSCASLSGGTIADYGHRDNGALLFNAADTPRQAVIS